MAERPQPSPVDQSQLQQSFQEMLSQLSGATLSSALIHLVPPTFSGGPDEDIHDWIERFEQVTLSLPSEQKNLLLDKAFIKAARAWFREELRPKLPTTDWTTSKREILEHFSGKTPQVRAYEKLMKLTYRPDRHASILYYIDEYTYLYKQAYPIHQQSEIVRAVVLSLPPNIKAKLNYMQDLSAITTVDVLKKTAKRYDQDGVEDQPNSGPVDFEMFNQSLKQAVKELSEQQILATKETLAAFMGKQMPDNAEVEEPTEEHICFARNGQRYNNPARNGQTNSNSGFRGDRQEYRNQPVCRCNGAAYSYDRRTYRNERPAYRNDRPAYRNDQQTYRNVRPAYDNNRPTYQNNPNGNNRGEQGPPAPCYSCGGDHWNRQCPRRQQNLN